MTEQTGQTCSQTSHKTQNFQNSAINTRRMCSSIILREPGFLNTERANKQIE